VARIVLVEDDAAIRTSLTRDLTAFGHTVGAAASGAEGLSIALSERPDLVVLDLGLPDLDGGDVMTMLRAVRDLPVIVITARDDETSMVRLLDAGADDYVVKPFRAAQLDARIRAVIRRSTPRDDDEADATIRIGELVIDPAAREVRLSGKSVELTRKEFDLIAALARRQGEVVSKRELLADVWQQPWGGADRTVDVHLSWLRRKLGETAAEPRYLHSVRGVGVRLAAPKDG
jgi:DNA-binding response OmpR family regulator